MKKRILKGRQRVLGLQVAEYKRGRAEAAIHGKTRVPSSYCSNSYILGWKHFIKEQNKARSLSKHLHAELRSE